MAFSEQIDKLVTRLTELTKDDKVSWQETGSANTFLVPVGKAYVSIGKSGSDVYGGYSFQIYDTSRVIDGVIAPFRGPENQGQAFQNWDRLRDLHEQARRSAVKADQVVSDLLSSLEQIH